jgi:hypothetical protein
MLIRYSAWRCDVPPHLLFSAHGVSDEGAMDADSVGIV